MKKNDRSLCIQTLQFAINNLKITCKIGTSTKLDVGPLIRIPSETLHGAASPPNHTKLFEIKQFYSGVFLGIFQTFDTVWSDLQNQAYSSNSLLQPARARKPFKLR